MPSLITTIYLVLTSTEAKQHTTCIRYLTHNDQAVVYHHEALVQEMNTFHRIAYNVTALLSLCRPKSCP